MTLQPLSAQRHERRYRRVFRWALGVSLLVHVAVFLAWRSSWLPPSTQSAAGPDNGGELAAAGGGMQAYDLSIHEPQPIPRPPEPIEVPDVDVPDVKPETEVKPVDVASLGPLGGNPGATPGRKDGTGRGAGGNAVSGRLRNTKPNPRDIIMPPNGAPKSIRGREVTIYLFVDKQGRVVADSTRITPPSGDHGWDRSLLQRANEWRFDPARRAGEPVATWTDIHFTVEG